MLRKILWRASEDPHFRQRALHNLGATLAEEGFILSDDEMRRIRELWEPLQTLSDRIAYERITALARASGR